MFEKILSEVQDFIQPLLALATWLLSLPRVVVKNFQDYQHFRRLANGFHGPRPWPLLGNLLHCGLPISASILFDCLTKETMVEYRRGQVWIGPYRVLFLNDPEDIKRYLQNSKNQSKDPSLYRLISHALGDGMVSANGDKWRFHNKIILPSFHSDILNSYVPILEKESDLFIELLRKYADGPTFDVKPMTERFTLEITLATICGVPSNSQMDDDVFIRNVEEGQAHLSHRIIRPWLHPDFFYYNSSKGKEFLKTQVIINGQCDKVIQTRMKILENQRAGINFLEESPNGKKRRNGFLDELLLQMSRGKITYKDVHDELKTFLLAGFDTTYILLLFSMYCLAKNPHIQEKALSELQELFEGYEGSDMFVKMLPRMEYLEMVMKETLRVFPPVWIIMRITGEDTPINSDNLVVPAGSRVIVSPKSLHTDPALYPNPEVFDPERFSPENLAKMHPFAFLPFSAGARSCTGKRLALIEAKEAIAKIIWNYKLIPDPTYEPEFLWGVSAVPHNGMRLRLETRRHVQSSE